MFLKKRNLFKYLTIGIIIITVLCNTYCYNIVFATEKDTKSETTISENDLYALSACLMDAESGRILFTKDADEKRAMASTTKIMTIIVTLENANLDDIVTVSENAAKQPDVQLNMRTGEQYKLEDLCYSLMLESHNDSAVAIAEHVGGSVEGFTKLMNKKAKELNCEDTYFITPNGLDAEDENGIHGTTAADLARIMSYCILKSEKSDDFLEITRTQTYSFSNIEGNRNFTCNNHNAFLQMMDGVISGKTGFTGAAGYCYVGALEREGRTFVVALLACGWPNNKTYKWSDMKKLMNYGIDNYAFQSFDEIAIDKSKLEPIVVKDGQTKKIGSVATSAISIVEDEKNIGSCSANVETNGILMRNDEQIKVEYDIKKELEAPIKAGEVVGNIKYMIGDEVWKVNFVVLLDDVKKIDFEWCLKKIVDLFEL